MDCQQGHLDLLVVKCLLSWRELKETFEEDLSSGEKEGLTQTSLSVNWL